MKRWLAPAGLLLGSIFTVFLIMEGMVRIFVPQPLFRFRFSPTLVWEQEPGAAYWYIKDEFQTFVRYNSTGLRDTEHNLKKEKGTFRIVTLGDSFTEALQVKLEEGYPKQLEEKLNRASNGRKYEVINFGTTGYGPDQYFLRLRDQAMLYEPDLVLVGVFINDLDDLAELDLLHLEGGALRFKSFGPLEALSKQIKFFARGHSHFFTFLTFRFQQLSASHLLTKVGLAAEPAKGSQMPELLRRYRKTYAGKMKTQVDLAEALFKGMRQVAEQGGARIGVVIFPAQEQVYEDRFLELQKKWDIPLPPEELDLNLPQELIGRSVRKAGIPSINLLPELKKVAETGTELYFHKDGHLNSLGNKKVAEILARELNERGWLEKAEEP